ncbi:MAG: glutathione S-transferase family protein [Rubellimicrobium sp.]|nr:glutathione S-transferase family protein [Rubellimicrobium sp.]
MDLPYRLHYAPDNASLCLRLALLARDLPFRTVLVDRSIRAQDTPAYRALHPGGLVPALETPDGTVFETAACLLYLADRHGGLFPGPGDAARGSMLSWLFWLSNTLHPALRVLFYPEQYSGPAARSDMARSNHEQIGRMLDTLEAALPRLEGWLGAEEVSILDCYLCPMLRWMALYPEGGTGWYQPARWPGLQAVAARMDARPITGVASRAEGLGPLPFSRPEPPDPPEGSPI